MIMLSTVMSVIGFKLIIATFHAMGVDLKIINIFKSSQIYLYSAFHNTDCIKSASQYH